MSGADAQSREVWSRRFAAYGAPLGGAMPAADATRPSVFDQLPVLAPEAEEALLQKAGFGDATPFYAAFTFRGWIAFA